MRSHVSYDTTELGHALQCISMGFRRVSASNHSLNKALSRTKSKLFTHVLISKADKIRKRSQNKSNHLQRDGPEPEVVRYDWFLESNMGVSSSSKKNKKKEPVKGQGILDDVNFLVQNQISSMKNSILKSSTIDSINSDSNDYFEGLSNDTNNQSYGFKQTKKLDMRLFEPPLEVIMPQSSQFSRHGSSSTAAEMRKSKLTRPQSAWSSFHTSSSKGEKWNSSTRVFPSSEQINARGVEGSEEPGDLGDRSECLIALYRSIFFFFSSVSSGSAISRDAFMALMIASKSAVMNEEQRIKGHLTDVEDWSQLKRFLHQARSVRHQIQDYNLNEVKNFNTSISPGNENNDNRLLMSGRQSRSRTNRPSKPLQPYLTSSVTSPHKQLFADANPRLSLLSSSFTAARVTGEKPKVTAEGINSVIASFKRATNACEEYSVIVSLALQLSNNTNKQLQNGKMNETTGYDFHSTVPNTITSLNNPSSTVNIIDTNLSNSLIQTDKNVEGSTGKSSSLLPIHFAPSTGLQMKLASSQKVTLAKMEQLFSRFALPITTSQNDGHSATVLALQRWLEFSTRDAKDELVRKSADSAVNRHEINSIENTEGANDSGTGNNIESRSGLSLMGLINVFELLAADAGLKPFEYTRIVVTQLTRTMLLSFLRVGPLHSRRKSSGPLKGREAFKVLEQSVGGLSRQIGDFLNAEDLKEHDLVPFISEPELVVQESKSFNSVVNQQNPFSLRERDGHRDKGNINHHLASNPMSSGSISRHVENVRLWPFSILSLASTGDSVAAGMIQASIVVPSHSSSATSKHALNRNFPVGSQPTNIINFRQNRENTSSAAYAINSKSPSGLNTLRGNLRSPTQVPATRMGSNSEFQTDAFDRDENCSHPLNYVDLVEEALNVTNATIAQGPKFAKEERDALTSAAILSGKKPPPSFEPLRLGGPSVEKVLRAVTTCGLVEHPRETLMRNAAIPPSFTLHNIQQNEVDDKDVFEDSIILKGDEVDAPFNNEDETEHDIHGDLYPKNSNGEFVRSEMQNSPQVGYQLVERRTNMDFVSSILPFRIQSARQVRDRRLLSSKSHLLSGSASLDESHHHHANMVLASSPLINTTHLNNFSAAPNSEQFRGASPWSKEVMNAVPLEFRSKLAFLRHIPEEGVYDVPLDVALGVNSGSMVSSLVFSSVVDSEKEEENEKTSHKVPEQENSTMDGNDVDEVVKEKIEEEFLLQSVLNSDSTLKIRPTTVGNVEKSNELSNVLSMFEEQATVNKRTRSRPPNLRIDDVDESWHLSDAGKGKGTGINNILSQSDFIEEHEIFDKDEFIMDDIDNNDGEENQQEIIENQIEEVIRNNYAKRNSNFQSNPNYSFKVNPPSYSRPKTSFVRSTHCEPEEENPPHIENTNTFHRKEVLKSNNVPPAHTPSYLPQHPRPLTAVLRTSVPPFVSLHASSSRPSARIMVSNHTQSSQQRRSSQPPPVSHDSLVARTIVPPLSLSTIAAHSNIPLKSLHSRLEACNAQEENFLSARPFSSTLLSSARAQWGGEGFVSARSSSARPQSSRIMQDQAQGNLLTVGYLRQLHEFNGSLRKKNQKLLFDPENGIMLPGRTEVESKRLESRNPAMVTGNSLDLMIAGIDLENRRRVNNDESRNIHLKDSGTKVRQFGRETRLINMK